MAGRPYKKGLEYFPFECCTDEKIELIEAEYGLKGFAIVVKLFQDIYGHYGYYSEWTPDKSALWARRLTGAAHKGNVDNAHLCSLPGFPKNLINDVVAASIRRNIFSGELFNKYRILTSSEIQEKYLHAASRREKVELKKEYLLISVHKNINNVYINSINDNKNSINVDTNDYSIVKNSIYNIYNNDNTEEDQVLCETAKNEEGIVLDDKTYISISDTYINELKEIYTEIDVMDELMRIRGWIKNNPGRIDPNKDIKKFVNRWMYNAKVKNCSKTSKKKGRDNHSRKQEEKIKHFESKDIKQLKGKENCPECGGTGLIITNTDGLKQIRVCKCVFDQKKS